MSSSFPLPLFPRKTTLQLPGWDTLDFSDIRDVSRGMLVAGDKHTSFNEDTAIASKAQDAVYDGTELVPCRSKCRYGPSLTQWRDELVNLRLMTGKFKMICEIQIVRSKMLLQRESMGG